MKKAFKSLALLSIVAVAVSSCKKETTDPVVVSTTTTPSYSIPTTYTFTTVDFSASTRRIGMLGEITTYIRSTHTTTVTTQPTLSAQKLKDMYANLNSQFTDATLNSSGLQLKDQTGTAFNLPAILEASFDDAEPASITAAANPTVTTASSGTSGKLVTTARAVLVDANGFEYKELAEKGLMGGVLYYRATTMLNNIGSYDNTTQTNGITAQQKAWDEAFGYYGVPVDFPTTTTGLKYWGSYGNSVNVAISCNSTMMNAFLAGRAAINNNDATRRDEARNTIIKTWEKIGAAKCISYLKGAKNNLSDVATLHHNLSEGYGFVKAFRYNPVKTISDADIATLEGYFGTNLYNMSTTNIDQAISKLETVFSLDASQIP
jgi:hypothetical protein